ncbi:aldehyde dehydrogenase family protein [Flavobacteriales bacterium]|nr:aldehyde dehydrogenase family protein [Flavobacteriales bacterium]
MAIPFSLIDKAYNQQNNFENLQELKNSSVKERLKRINKIANYINEPKNVAKITAALSKDLGKSEEEVTLSEIYPLLLTIKTVTKNLKRWSQDEYLPTPLTMIGLTSSIKYEPKGHVLIIGPWNYPFMLSINPLIYAIAAGNAVIVKPSEIAANTSSLVKEMISEIFPTNEVTVIEGGIEETTHLLAKKFNHIYFTGSPNVGKVVMEASAKHLCSVTLELGGKSPVIIDQTTNIKTTAKKIAWAKTLNCGQTCIAPDYILVKKEVEKDFIAAYKQAITELLDPQNNGINNSAYFGKIINKKNYDRLINLIEDAKEKGALVSDYSLASKENKFIPPVVVANANNSMSIMKEEIFGPLLPIITFESLNDVITQINELPKPLALYIMSKSSKTVDHIINNTSAGNTMVNELMMNVAHPDLPFGGVNNSGIGKSNGRYSFINFSNERGLMKRKWGTHKFIYPPFNKTIYKLLKIIARV